jgi:CDP-paratose 2-epimerase
MSRVKRQIVITGGAGFIGVNLADRLAGMGHDVLIFDALARAGVEHNLAWLQSRHPRRIRTMIGDVREPGDISCAVDKAAAVFHLAAQVDVTSSLVNPVEDADVNLRGTLNLLEAIRERGGRIPLIFASTNKVYGNLSDIPLEIARDGYFPRDRTLRSGIDESRPLQFHTPYGCSKGAADQYVLDYAHSFGLQTCVLRMSCIYGPHQMGTEDQGWVAHFVIRALADEAISIYGDGRQVRDLLFVSDAVDAYVAAWSKIDAVKGRAFNLGGGEKNAVSLRALLRQLETLMGRSIRLRYEDWRPGDQRYYVSNTAAVQEALGIGPPKVGWRAGLLHLADWLRGQDAAQTAPASVTAAAAS